MGFPEERDRVLQDRAINAQEFAEDLTGWLGTFNPPRIEQDLCPVPPNQESDALLLRRLTGNLFRSTRVPVAAAVYGASQVGKSLFVGRVLRPLEQERSPLGRDERLGPPAYYANLSFDHDLNPRCGRNEATAIVTRFTTKDRFELSALQAYPVLVKALSRSEWLRVLARGFMSECKIPTERRWDDAALEHLFEETAKTHGAPRFDREWRMDLLDVFSYMKRLLHWLYGADETVLNGLLTRYPLSNEGYADVAATLFWNKDHEISELFVKVCRFLERIQRKDGERGMLVHWMGVRFLLDSQRTSERHSEHSECFKDPIKWSDFVMKQDGDWWVLDYQPGRRGTEEDLATIQSALLEMVIPVVPELLAPEWQKVLEKSDFLDIPGLIAAGETGMRADSIERLMNIVKRGKVFFLFDRYIEELQIQTLLVLISGETLSVRGLLKSYVDRWGKGRYGEQAWPSGFGEEASALFLGMTGLDTEFITESATPSLYENRLRAIVDLTFENIMKDFGKAGRAFTDIYPIRYPGTWDYDDARRAEKNEPIKKWVEAGEAFLKSELVRTYVADAEVKWRHAMRDDDGGALLIARAFEQVNSAQKKQSELERRIAETRQMLADLGLSWVVNPDSNIDRNRRIATAEQVVRWLHSDPSSVYWRIGAIESALCLDTGDVFPLADLAEIREAVMGRRPEPLEVRFPTELRTFLQDWGTTWAPNRWKKHVADLLKTHPDSGPWLEPEHFSAFSRYLADYLLSPSVFTELCEQLLPIVKLKLVDSGAKKHARRKFMRIVLNDFVMNPGSSLAAIPDVVLSENVVEVTARSKLTNELLNANYGLMATVLNRWRGRLGSALASGAGQDVKIPPGNDELVKILKRFNVT